MLLTNTLVNLENFLVVSTQRELIFLIAKHLTLPGSGFLPNHHQKKQEGTVYFKLFSMRLNQCLIIIIQIDTSGDSQLSQALTGIGVWAGPYPASKAHGERELIAWGVIPLRQRDTKKKKKQKNVLVHEKSYYKYQQLSLKL